MLIKKAFALFWVSAAMTAFSVSAGGIRGVVREEDIGITRGRRHLKNENNFVRPVPVQATNPAPVRPPVPVMPKGLDLWLSKCSTRDLESCVPQNKFNGCTQCLYAQSFLSTSSIKGLKNCADFLCNECESAAVEFYYCATQRATEPAPVPVVTVPQPAPAPVPAPVEPMVPVVDDPEVTAVTTTSEDDITTSLGCPFIPSVTGDSCAGRIPAPFLFQKCYFRDVICTCRTDDPVYSCVDRNFPPAPVPIVPPPSTPVAIPSESGDSGCSDDTVSGTVCSSVGSSCCVGDGLCICGSDNRFVCQEDGCGEEEPPAPVAAPVVTPVVTTTTTPLTSPTPPPTTEPITEAPALDEPVAPVPEVPVEQDGSGVPIPSRVNFSIGSDWCPASIRNCEPCAAVLPEGAIDGACSAQAELFFDGIGYIAEVQCRCFTQENPNPIWECRYVGGNLGTVLIPVAPICSDILTLPPVSSPVPETLQPVQEILPPVVEFPVVEIELVEPVPETPVEEEPVSIAPVDPIQVTVPEGSGVPIPEGVDFSLGSEWCPSRINNCDPCGEALPEGFFNGSCSAQGKLDIEGEMYIATIQCRCFTQNNPNPLWQCRYVGGNLGSLLVPVSPSCSDPVPETEPVQEITVPLVPIGSVPDPPVSLPENIITEIPLTKVCLSVLPTSGLTPCDLPEEGAICCHNVQFAIATVCTCEDNKFQCAPGIPSDCPDDQNPNVIPTLAPGN